MNATDALTRTQDLMLDGNALQSTRHLQNPDFLTPGQYSGRVSNLRGIGERRLMAAVLEACLDRLTAARRSTGTKAQEIATEEWEYLDSEDRSWPFSFRNICDQLGMDGDAIREQLRRTTGTLKPVTPSREALKAQARDARSDQAVLRDEDFGEMSRRIRITLRVTRAGLADVLQVCGSRRGPSEAAVYGWEHRRHAPQGTARDALVVAFHRYVIARETAVASLSA